MSYYAVVVIVCSSFLKVTKRISRFFYVHTILSSKARHEVYFGLELILLHMYDDNFIMIVCCDNGREIWLKIHIYAIKLNKICYVLM